MSDVSIRSSEPVTRIAPLFNNPRGTADQSNSPGLSSPQASQSVSPIDKIQTVKELKSDELKGNDVAVGEEVIVKAIEKANKALTGANTSFEFSIHEKTKQIMVKVLDKDTGQVIREIPPEKVLDMVAHLWEMAGVIVDEKR